MRRVLKLLMAMLSASVVCGCGDDDKGCQTDQDCYEPRICVEGRCVFPDEGGGGSASTACTVDSQCKSPRICVEGRCVLPDEGGDAGDDRGSSVNERQPCIEKATPLEENGVTELGFTAAEVLAFVEGVHEAELIWPDGTRTALTFTVTAISASFISSTENPEYVLLEGLNCEDHIALEVASTFVTDDGQFNETWTSLIFESPDKDRADTVLTVNMDGIAGSYSPEASSGQCILDIQFNISLSADAFSGSMLQTVAGAACDAIQPFTGVSPREAGSWSSSSE